MLTELDASKLKAYMTATWMGVVDVRQGQGGCDTCGFGAESLNTIDLEGLHKLVDDFFASNDNKEI